LVVEKARKYTTMEGFCNILFETFGVYAGQWHVIMMTIQAFPPSAKG